MQNLYAIYQNAASVSARLARLVNITDSQKKALGFSKMKERVEFAEIAADHEQKSRNAYLASCPNSSGYLNRKTANT